MCVVFAWTPSQIVTPSSRLGAMWVSVAMTVIFVTCGLAWAIPRGVRLKYKGIPPAEKRFLLLAAVLVVPILAGGLGCVTFSILFPPGPSGLGGPVHPSSWPEKKKVQELTNAEYIELRRLVVRNSLKVFCDEGRGSGFVIFRQGPNCVVMTNAHVVLKKDGKPSLEITISSPANEAHPLPAKVITYFYSEGNHQMDYAFVGCHDSKNLLGQPVPIGKAPKIGDFVLAVGSPLEEDFMVDDGHVVSVSSDTFPLIIHDAVTEHGSSGGGLFDRDGKLVGISTYVIGDSHSGALSVQPLLAGVRFQTYSLEARTSGWQETGIRVGPGESVHILALGRWYLGFVKGLRGPGGTSGYAEYTPEKAAPHGALLARIGSRGQPVAISKVWKEDQATDYGLGDLKADAAGAASLWLRCNDSSYQDNSGTMNVLVLLAPW